MSMPLSICDCPINPWACTTTRWKGEERCRRTDSLWAIYVLDLSEDIAGPFCSKLLAGLGAEVIKVERPGSGDVSRRAGPGLRATPHPEESALFLYLNTGKKSITLDVESQIGVIILRRLAQDCDLLIESFCLDT